jgi:hypothetical protein
MFNAQMTCKEFNMTNKPTITRFHAGLYYATGWVAGNLVQYSVLKASDGWVLTKTYGHGPEFYAAFDTKRAAINALVGA